MGRDAHIKLPGTNTIRRSVAYFLVALADTIYPAPHIAGLANPELDTYLARFKRGR